MLLKYSKTRAPYIIFFTILVSFFIVSKNVEIIITNPGLKINIPKYTFLYDYLPSQGLIINILLSLVFLYISFAFSRLNYKYRFIKEKTILPSIVFIILMSNSLLVNGFTPILFAILFMFLSIDKVFSMYKSSRAVTKAFEAGFLLV
jgi:hypothetical protein